MFDLRQNDELGAYISGLCLHFIVRRVVDAGTTLGTQRWNSRKLLSGMGARFYAPQRALLVAQLTLCVLVALTCALLLLGLILLGFVQGNVTYGVASYIKSESNALVDH